MLTNDVVSFEQLGPENDQIKTTPFYLLQSQNILELINNDICNHLRFRNYAYNIATYVNFKFIYIAMFYKHNF